MRSAANDQVKRVKVTRRVSTPLCMCAKRYPAAYAAHTRVGLAIYFSRLSGVYAGAIQSKSPHPPSSGEYWTPLEGILVIFGHSFLRWLGTVVTSHTASNRQAYTPVDSMHASKSCTKYSLHLVQLASTH